MANPANAAWEFPTDRAIKDLLVERIDKQRDGVGIVVGIIDRDGGRVVAHGRLGRRGKREVDGDAIFEICSITKVFTSLLLSDMARRGEVALDDPVSKHLPHRVTVPERAGREITLADLATYTSGLPQMPTNLARTDTSNPYVGYTVEQLYAFLSGHALARDIGSAYQYSNVGGGLLGHALARRKGTDFENLVNERITGPLGLRDTAFRLSPAQRRRLARGHDDERRAVPNWELPEAVAGGGGLYSTASDLLTFLAVALGYHDAPLKGAMDDQLAFPTRATGAHGLSVGLGWHATENERGRVVWHNGGSAGYKTFMGLNPARGWGAVVLTNTAATRGATDIGMHLLMGAPLATAPNRRRSILVKAAVLDAYVGRYRFSTDGFGWIEISRWGDDLYAEVDRQGIGRIFAAGPTRFFWKIVDSELTFQVNAAGRAIGLMIRHAGREYRAERAEAVPVVHSAER